MAMAMTARAACPDRWHCHPHLAAHACDVPNRSRPCPTCGATPRPVTGPDGDNPISDEQIRELQASIVAYDSTDDALDALCDVALYSTAERQSAARTRCAEAWNARLGVK